MDDEYIDDELTENDVEKIIEEIEKSSMNETIKLHIEKVVTSLNGAIFTRNDQKIPSTSVSSSITKPPCCRDRNTSQKRIRKEELIRKLFRDRQHRNKNIKRRSTT